jgi:ribosomal protein S27E
MQCDVCPTGRYINLLVEACVKSSVYYRVQCTTCGHQQVNRSNTKRDERRYM